MSHEHEMLDSLSVVYIPMYLLCMRVFSNGWKKEERKNVENETSNGKREKENISKNKYRKREISKIDYVKNK